MATSRGKAIRFRVSDVRPMGRVAAGVKGIRLLKNDVVVAADAVGTGGKVLLVSLLGYGFLTDHSEFPLQKRGGSGVVALKVSEKSGPLAVMRMVFSPETDPASHRGRRGNPTPVSQIRMVHRASLGVRLMKAEPETGWQPAPCSRSQH